MKSKALSFEEDIQIMYSTWLSGAVMLKVAKNFNVPSWYSLTISEIFSFFGFSSSSSSSPSLFSLAYSSASLSSFYFWSNSFFYSLMMYSRSVCPSLLEMIMDGILIPMPAPSSDMLTTSMSSSFVSIIIASDAPASSTFRTLVVNEQGPPLATKTNVAEVISFPWWILSSSDYGIGVHMLVIFKLMFKFPNYTHDKIRKGIWYLTYHTVAIRNVAKIGIFRCYSAIIKFSLQIIGSIHFQLTIDRCRQKKRNYTN